MSRFVGWAATFTFIAAGAGTWWHTHSWWKTAFVSLGFAILAFGKKIWIEIESDWVKSISLWMNPRLAIWSSRFRRRYFQFLGNSYSKADFQGFRAQGEFALDLDEIYVDQQVIPAVFESIPQNPVPLTPTPEAGFARDVVGWLKASTERPMNFAIIGAPGIGKTTLFKHLTLLSMRKNTPLPWLPVLLFLRDHVDAITVTPSTSIVTLLEQTLKDLEPPSGWFRDHLTRGKCLVMLDGLDEIADLKKRKEVARWVARQVAIFGGCRFLVSSRPNGYKESHLAGFSVLRVSSFNREQIESFLRSWYIASESKGDRATPITYAKAAVEAEQLLAELRNTPALAELAINPLLLALIATVHRNLHRLPGSRVELFTEICELFLGKLQEERGLASDIAPPEKMRVLEVLAYQMMCRECDRIEADEAVSLITGVLDSVKPGYEPAAFLKMVEDSSSLLVQHEEGVYGFPHRSFQEFLASRYIKRHRVASHLVTHVDQPWWYETTLLYAAQADGTLILDACLADSQPSVEALLLATDLEACVSNITPQLQERLRSITVAALDNVDAKRRNVAAEYVLARRIRKMRWIDHDCYIDTSPVSQAEYQLFIDESWSRGESRQPEYWGVYAFELGQGGTPVEGIRKDDAEAFCRWLTEREPGNWRYLLPNSQVLGPALMGHWTPGEFYTQEDSDEFPSPSGEEILDKLKVDMVRILGARDTLGLGLVIRRLGWFRLWLGQYVSVGGADKDSSARSGLASFIRQDVDLYNTLVLEKVRELDIALRRALSRDRGLDRGIDYAIGRVAQRALHRDLTIEEETATDALTRDSNQPLALDHLVSLHDLGAGIARDLAISLAEVLIKTLSRRATRQIANLLVQELNQGRAARTVHDLTQPRMMVAWLSCIDGQVQDGRLTRKKVWIARRALR
jgi:hypothetical protein